MEKKDLRKAALQLAGEELSVRLMCDKELRSTGKISESTLVNGQRRVSEAAAKANKVRRLIPELCEKKYWWDIPFDAAHPISEFPDTFSLSDGVFSEKDYISLEAGKMKQKQTYYPGGTVININMSGVTDTVLYLNRQEMKKHLSDEIQVKNIVCSELISGGRPREKKEYHGVIPGSWEYNQWAENLEFMKGELPEQVEEYNRKEDRFERFFHDSYYTNEERFMRGWMSAEDYYREETWRWLGEHDVIEKNREKQSHYRNMMETAHREYAQFVSEQIVNNHQAGSPELFFIECGNVYYYEDQLLAVTIPNTARTVFEVKLTKPCSMVDMDGEYKQWNELMAVYIDPVPVIDYIIEKYSPEMKPYSVLNPRPRGASDQIWRVWAERRFAYSAYLGSM